MVFYVIMLAKEAFGNRGGHIVKQTAIGILAHVDSGKTTLSEALLYCTGNLQKLGRVDHRDSFLDTYALERDRGITIFSKQAVLACDNARYYLLDTPGHVACRATPKRSGVSCKNTVCRAFCLSTKWICPARTRPVCSTT